jgi:hypothetical protein
MLPLVPLEPKLGTEYVPIGSGNAHLEPGSAPTALAVDLRECENEESMASARKPLKRG